MPITYRREKGSPLTTEEIDENFRELESRLNALTANSEGGEGLGKIYLAGDQISFTGTFGADFGTFTLPKASLSPCVAWATQTPYKTHDVVTVESSLYCCTQEHMSTIWAQDSPFWKLAFTFPQPPPPSLPLYEKASLPETEIMGKLAVLLEEEGPTLIFFNGNKWQRLIKGENL